MASKKRTALGLFISSLLVLLATALAALPLMPTPDPKLNGFGAMSLLPLDGLLILTLAAYSLALVVSHTRLALMQSIATTVYGIVMIVVGLSLFVMGIAKFTGLIALLLAFPFGTIAYFIKFSCTSNPGQFFDFMGSSCFARVQLVAIATMILKLVALAVLISASFGFAKVRGLLLLSAFAALFSLCIAGLLGALSGLKFLMFPADAVLTAVFGVVVLIYGIVTFIKSLFGLALSIAGQVS